MAKVKPLRQSLLFQDFSPREIAMLAQVVEEVKLNPGEALAMLSSEHSLGLVIVVSGQLTGEYSARGKTVRVGFRPMDYFGELNLVSSQRSAQNQEPVHLKALDDCKVLQLVPSRFEELSQREPSLAFKIVKSLARSVQNRILSQQRILERVL